MCCYTDACSASRGCGRTAQLGSPVLNHIGCISGAQTSRNLQTTNNSVSHLQMRLKKPRRWAFRTRSPSWLRIALMNWTSQMDASAR